MLTAIIISALITIAGFIKVHRDGTYESIWGGMLIYGAIATVALLAFAGVGAIISALTGFVL